MVNRNISENISTGMRLALLGVGNGRTARRRGGINETRQKQFREIPVIRRRLEGDCKSQSVAAVRLAHPADVSTAVLLGHEDRARVLIQAG